MKSSFFHWISNIRFGSVCFSLWLCLCSWSWKIRICIQLLFFAFVKKRSSFFLLVPLDFGILHRMREILIIHALNRAPNTIFTASMTLFWFVSDANEMWMSAVRSGVDRLIKYHFWKCCQSSGRCWYRRRHMIYNYDGSATAAFPCVILIATHHIRHIRSLLPGHIFHNRIINTKRVILPLVSNCIAFKRCQHTGVWRVTRYVWMGNQKIHTHTHSHHTEPERTTKIQLITYLWFLLVIIIMSKNCQRTTVVAAAAAADDVDRQS